MGGYVSYQIVKKGPMEDFGLPSQNQLFTYLLKLTNDKFRALLTAPREALAILDLFARASLFEVLSNKDLAMLPWYLLPLRLDPHRSQP